jgi:hypothetical protein
LFSLEFFHAKRISDCPTFATFPPIPQSGESRVLGIDPMNHPEQDEPVYWFVLLEKAVHRGDFDEAARAKQELKRLGVSVAYRKLKKEKPREPAAK